MPGAAPRLPRGGPVWMGFIAIAWVVLGPSEAAADSTRQVAERVAEQWRMAGARVVSLPTRFVFDEETLVLPVLVDPSAGCTHIALIGARGLGFRAKLSDGMTDTSARGASVAGVVELRRCGGASSIRQVLVTSDAGRGSLEVIVAQAPSALPSLGAIIPERTGGVLPPAPEAGVLPPLPDPQKRAEVAESRARREGAQQIETRRLLRAGLDGAGEVEVALRPGCHRVELFARDPRAESVGRFRLDVDAELRDPSTERVLARDRTEAPDARLEACVGRLTTASVVFAGAPPNGELTATLVSWPLPPRLPALWGPVVQGKMARVMFARHVVAPASDPVFLAQGSSGTTPFPVPVEAGGCYVAIVALTHGHARSLQLRSVVGKRESTDERGAAEESALSAFCVGPHDRARVQVHARGTGVGFGLAVYRVKSGEWEAGR